MSTPKGRQDISWTRFKSLFKDCGNLFVNGRVSLENVNSLKITVYFMASISLAAECSLVVAKQVNIMSEHVH